MLFTARQLNSRTRRGLFLAMVLLCVGGLLVLTFPVEKGKLNALYIPGGILLYPVWWRGVPKDPDSLPMLLKVTTLFAYAVIGFATGAVFKRLRTGVIVSGVLVGVLVLGAITCDFLMATVSSRPPWMRALPGDCKVIHEQPGFVVGIFFERPSSFFEGIGSFCKARTARPPSVVLQEISKNLESIGSFRSGTYRNISARDLESRNAQPSWLRSQLIRRSPSSEDFVIMHSNGGTKFIRCYGWATTNGTVLEMWESTSL